MHIASSNHRFRSVFVMAFVGLGIATSCLCTTATMSRSHAMAQTDDRSLAQSADDQEAPAEIVSELSEEEAKSVKIAERFFSILKKSPRRGTALERIYGHHVEFGTLDKLIQTLNDDVVVNPEDGVGWMLLGLFESHRGQDAEAVDAFVNAERLRADDAMPSFYLGQSLLLIGQPDKAVEAYERAIDRAPRRADMLEIFRQLGRVHQRAQRTDAALDVWNRLEAMFPDDARVQEQIALTMVEEGAYAMALPRYEKLTTLVKDDYRRVTFSIEAAELKIRLNQRDEGIADLEKLLSDLNPTGWLFRDVRRRIEDVFLRSGDQDGLVTYYQKWIENNPEDVSAIARLARFLASSARVDEASQWMEKALTLAPKRTDLRRSFIGQLVNDQRYQEASKQYALLVKSAPGNPDFLRDWGKLVMKDRSIDKDMRRQQAVKIWNRIVDARPNDALTHAQVADLYRQSGLESEAVERYQKAIELAPNEPQYREYLGEFYHILQRPEEALSTWASIATEGRDSAENVARLAEVYNSFGYLPQAVKKIALACQREPKEFPLQLKSAEYHMRNNQFDEALVYNAAAKNLSATDEENELALKNRIEIFQNSRKMDEEIERLTTEVSAAGEPTVEAWHQLARYLEADRRWAEATEAIEKALAISAESIPVLTSSARIAETSGDFGRAATENRKLAKIDRRLRSEHLMNVARLEAQLGNRDQALAAGRELIVSAPGNTENYEFYSQLCYRLGETELALDALRKAVRINPTEPSLTMALGRALAEEFRTDEAIEVYWRAFEKSEEIDDRTTLVEKLTKLYLQQNQLEKLLERLERDRQEESKRREMTICLAQAHNTSGDYGTARRELESLLTDDTRDTNLLQQLSKLCESGSDLDAAVEYQTQLAQIAPGHETEFRLAKLLFSRGDRDAAADIFVRLTAREENPARLLKSVDSLLQRSNFESVVKITEPLLSESRDDWELLYREAVAWAKLEKFEEAGDRFNRLLALNLPHDKMGFVAAEKMKRANAKARSKNLQGIRTQVEKQQSPLMLARSQVSGVKQAAGLVQENYYSQNQLPPLWTPSHYGVARMAAFGWLIRFENDAELTRELVDEQEGADTDQTDEDPKEVETLADRIATLGSDTEADQEAIYDWLYVENLRGGNPAIFEIARRLAVDGGKAEQEFFLSSLAMRSTQPGNRNSNRQQTLPDPEPLSDADIDLMLKCFKATTKEDAAFGNAFSGSGQVLYSGGRMYIQSARGGWVPVNKHGGSLSLIVKELRLADRAELADQMVNERIDSAETATQLTDAMKMLITEKKLDRIEEYFALWQTAAKKEIELAPEKVNRRGKSANKHSVVQTARVLPTILKWTGPLAADGENAKVLTVIDQTLDVEIQERIKTRRQQSLTRRPRRSNSNRYYNSRITFQYGDESSRVEVEYPRSSVYLSTVGISLLRQAYETLKRNEVVEDLTALLRQRVATAQSDAPETLLYERMMLATVLYWQDEQLEAIELFRAVAQELKDDPKFALQIAQLYEKLGEFDEALAIVDAINPREQKLLQEKETRVLRLAERLGDIERARTAAERLFGLRLNTETQLSLEGKMRRLGMVDKADAVIARAQRRSGQKIPSMASLMVLYQGQGKTELAAQVAHRILQRTKSNVTQKALFNRNQRYSSSNSTDKYRTQAVSTLRQVGALQPVIDRLEEQLQRSPDSPVIYEQLIEFYLQTNATEKLLPILKSAAEARPRSAYFRELLAKQYATSGKNSEACAQYTEAIRINPSILSSSYYEIKQFFQTADRMGDLLQLFEEINIRKIGRPYYVVNLATEMLRKTHRQNQESLSEEEKKANKKIETIALRLAEKIFEEYPNYRRNVISSFRGEQIWKNNRVYNLARKSLIPTVAQAKTDPWHGMNDISSYSGDGTVDSMFHDIFEGIEGTEQEEELLSTIRKNVQKKPNWLAGKIMLAMFDVRGDREEQARQSLTEIFKDEKVLDSIKGDTAWLVAQELEKFPETRDLAIQLLEKTVKTSNRNSSQIQYSAKGKLIMSYVSSDQHDKARQALLDAVEEKSTQNYNREYELYRRGETINWVAEKLVEIDCPVDATMLLQGMLNNKELLKAWKQYGGNRIESATKLYEQSLKRALADDKSVELADKIVTVRKNPRTGEGAFDLQVGIQSDGEANTIPTLSSELLEFIGSMSKKKNGKKLLAERLSKLRAENPDDLTIALADTWSKQNENSETFASAIKALLQIDRDSPLEEIKAGRRPNARQRREAMQRVAAWIIGRKCLESNDETLQDLGNELGAIAVAGASRQTDQKMQNSILFEWGDSAAKRKDLKLSEEKWSLLLEEVTRRPTSKKREPKKDKAPPIQGVGKMDHQNSFDQTLVQWLAAGRFEALLVPVQDQMAVDLKSMPQDEAKGDEDKDVKSKFIPPLTISQFDIAAQIAKSAADHGMTNLSQRAMRELVRGGLPVADPDFSTPDPNWSNRNSTSKAPMDEAAFGKIITSILERWEDSDGEGVAEGYQVQDVYQMLAEKVFPSNRRNEILMFEDSSGVENADVKSLGQELVKWADRADQLADLQKKIEQRESKPAAIVAAMVLKGLVALQKKDIPTVNLMLEKLLTRITEQPVPRDVLLACHLATPAYEVDPAILPTAVAIFKKQLSVSPSKKGVGKMVNRVNRHLVANGSEEEVKKFFEEHLAKQQAQYANYSGDYGMYQVQIALYEIAGGVAKTDLPELALDYFGRGLDMKATQYGRGTKSEKVWSQVANKVRGLNPTQRFKTLLTWTLPESNRQTLRFVAGWKPRSEASPNALLNTDSQSERQSSLPGLNCNFLDLTDAAVEAKSLGDLKAAVDEVDYEKFPKVDVLKACIAIAEDDIQTAKKLVRQRIDKADTPKQSRNRYSSDKWLDVLLYRLCMRHSDELATLYDFEQRRKIFSVAPTNVKSALRRDFELSRARKLDAKLTPGVSPNLKAWSTDRKSPWTNGKVDTWIVADGQQIISLGSGQRFNYWMNYPITGDFQFSCDVYRRSSRRAEIGYGGVTISGSSHGYSQIAIASVSDTDQIQRRTRTSGSSNPYSRVTIDVKNDQLKYYRDGDLIYQEQLTGTYPWLMLFSDSKQPTSWRNPKLTGQPEILTEVDLVVGDRIEGWIASGGSLREFRKEREEANRKKDEADSNEKAKEKKEPEDYDWHARDSIVFGKAHPKDDKDVFESLVYHRPLFESESLAYEFRYQPDKMIASPLIGGLAFSLIDGEKIREVVVPESSGEDKPKSRQSFDTSFALSNVELKPDQWNQTEIRIVDANAEILINGSAVYRRPIESLNVLQIGFEKPRTWAAEVRNLKLNGDWQEKLDEALSQQLFASDQQLEEVDRNLIAESIGDQFRTTELHAFYDSSATSDPKTAQSRYQELKDWVLPNFGHGIRLDSKEPDPSDGTSKASNENMTAARSFELQCPAYELAVLAKKLNKVSDLNEELDKLKVPENKTSNSYRKQLILKAIVAIVSEKDEVAKKHLADVYSSCQSVKKLNEKNRKKSRRYFTPIEIDPKPINLVACYAADRPALLDVANSLFDDNGGMLFQTALRSRAANKDAPRSTLQQWQPIRPASYGDTRFRSGGVSTSLDDWSLSSRGILEHVPGAIGSTLLFQSPLRGKFEITADVALMQDTKCWLDFGGIAVVPGERNARIRSANGNAQNQDMKRKVPHLHSIAHYRIEVDGTKLETYVNDVRVHRGDAANALQPWLSISANSSRQKSLVQNLRITGTPEIPTELNLLAADHPRWTAAFGESFSSANFIEETYNSRQYYQSPTQRQGDSSQWLLEDGVLAAGNLSSESIDEGYFLESWLYYRRPMLEDGEYEFEVFVDKSQKQICFPAIGTTALLINPDGVYRHEIGRSSDKDNVEELTQEPEEQKIEGSSGCQWKDSDWNQILIRIEGDQATLSVNQKEMATVEIVHSTSQRYPGLFRYADQSNAKVRNVKYRGQWPTELPAIDQQELALGDQSAFADSVSGTPTVYDLSNGVEDLKTAGLSFQGGQQMETTEAGLKITTRKNADSDNWPKITMPIDSNRPFDVSVDFSELKITKVKGWGCNLDLEVRFVDDQNSAITMGTRRDASNDLFLMNQKEYDQPDGTRDYDFTQLFEPSPSGSFRFVRQDEKLYALAAGEDGQYIVIDSHHVGQKKVAQIDVVAKSATDNAELDAVIHRISLNAAPKK